MNDNSVNKVWNWAKVHRIKWQTASTLIKIDLVYAYQNCVQEKWEINIYVVSSYDA